MSLIGRMRLRRLTRQDQRQQVEAVVAQLSARFADAPAGRIFVVMVGVIKSGKTTFVVEHPQLRRFARVNSSAIHQALNDRLGHWNQDSSDWSAGYDARHRLEQRIRLELLEQAFRFGVAVVDDSCNLRRNWRRQIIALAQSYGYRTAIVWLSCSEHVLIERLASLAEAPNGRWPAWALWTLQSQYHDRPFNGHEADERYLLTNGFCDRPINFKLF